MDMMVALVHVTNALERIIHAAVGEFDNDFLNGVVVILRVDEIGGTELSGQGFLGRVGVDGNDAFRLGHHGTLNHRQADATEAEHSHGRAGFDFGGVEDRADTGGHAAAQQADLVQWRFLAHLGQGNFRHHGVLGEGAGAHIVV